MGLCFGNGWPLLPRTSWIHIILGVHVHLSVRVAEWQTASGLFVPWCDDKGEVVRVCAADRVIGCSDLSGKIEGSTDNSVRDISGLRPGSQIQWKTNTRMGWRDRLTLCHMIQLPCCRGQPAQRINESDCFKFSTEMVIVSLCLPVCSYYETLSPALLGPALSVTLRPICCTSILSVSSDDPQAEHCCCSIHANSNQECAKVMESSVTASVNSALLWHKYFITKETQFFASQ